MHVEQSKVEDAVEVVVVVVDVVVVVVEVVVDVVAGVTHAVRSVLHTCGATHVEQSINCAPTLVFAGGDVEAPEPAPDVGVDVGVDVGAGAGALVTLLALPTLPIK